MIRTSDQGPRPKRGGSRRLWLFAAAVVLIAVLGASAFRHATLRADLAQADLVRIPEDPRLLHFAMAQGRTVYRQRCASCHGPQGRGDPARNGPDLTDADWLYGSGQIDEIQRVVLYGIRSHDPRAMNLADMPGFARRVPYPREPTLQPLTPDEIDDVVSFVADRGALATSPSATRGAAIFAGKGECYDCHGSDARGDPAIGAPNLTDKIWLYGNGSRQSIWQSVAMGRQGVCPARVRTMDAVSVRAVSTYVYVLSHPNLKAARP